MRKIYRKLHFLSNIATIIIAVLLTLIAAKMYLSPAPPTQNFASSVETVRMPVKPDSQPKTNLQITPVGKVVPIQGIDWKTNKKTLVLYVSAKCRYCTESAPFYQQLVKEHSSKNVSLMAVLPQSVEEGKDYLKGLGANIDDVYNAQLASIGVTATPTLLLVDENGVVSDMWRGKLSDDKETEVINKLSS